MTEAEWLACTDPSLMLDFLDGRASDRKLRLFAVACCRRIWHLLADPRLQDAVITTEQYADGKASDQERHAAFDMALDAANKFTDLACECGSGEDDPTANAGYAVVSASCSSDAFARYDSGPVTVAGCAAIAAADEWEEPVSQCKVLRDLFGNIFHPVIVDPRWLKTIVISLAEAIYENHAFDRLPILADALEDAGCDNADVLAHCRGDGPHVRGCWVVDLILGKD